MRQRRAGMALMVLVVALAVLSVMLSATTWQIVAHRRTLERRFNQQQALWLARAGIEHAAGRLLADPAGEASAALELVPNSAVRVTVRREPGKGDAFQVTSESRFPSDAPHPVVRTETRRFRRVLEDGKVRLTVMANHDTTDHATMR
jgi:type II secretory pathway pseudopilin PulG